MRIEIENSVVRIFCEGMAHMRLKASLYGRLREKLTTDKTSLSFPLSSYEAVRDLLPSDAAAAPAAQSVANKYSAHGHAREALYNILTENDSSAIPDYWQQALDPPQAVAVAGMTVPGMLGLCLFDEQGSGKTVMTIAAFDILKDAGKIDAMIVVCPKSMLGEWPKDLERFRPGKYNIAVAEGAKEDRYQIAQKPFDVFLTNFESVDHLRVTLAATASTKRILLAVDESYYLKNADSSRSDAAGKLRESCTRCFVLCGTPAPNSPYDLVNQFDLADMGYTFGGFRKTANPDADRDRISELVETRGTYIRRLKTEILEDVPDKSFHVIRVPLTGRQALMYEKARSDLELELRGLDNVTFKKKLVSYFQKRAALLQICSSPTAIDPTLAEQPVKLEKLDALLHELISQGRKVVLWSCYRNSLDELVERYQKYSPVRIDGSVTSSTERRQAVTDFQTDPTKMLFIGNPAAAGAGITLHASYDAVYFSYSNQAAHYLQSLDRIHRRGQVAKEVNYYLLVCENTIEETEVLRLRQKELQQHSLLGDDINWPSSLDDALGELQHIGV